MEIQEFINQLNTVKGLKLIYNYEALKVALLKLNKLIGMKNVKDTIISQIKYYMINKAREQESHTQILESHMFHTTVLGPPGSGKTTLVEILAEIWICIGLLKVKNNITVEKELSNTLNFNLELISLKNRMSKIKHSMILDKNKILGIKRKVANLNQKINSKELTSMTIQLDRITSSINRNIKIYCENDRIINIDKVEDEDYDMEFSEVEEYNSFNPSEYVIKLKRSDLIGKYVGQTAIKTREALMKGLDKVIFIDEAYELYNTSNDSGTDSFGMECLSTILNFMNEFSDRCIIVFAGYEQLLKDTIFRVQPGLERRIAFSFELTEYNPSELVEIYEKQLKEKKWSLTDKTKISLLFEKNKKLFKFGGGDTARLCLYTKNIYAKYAFQKLLNNEEIDSIINYDIVKEALEILKSNSETQGVKISEPPPGMYL